MRFIPTWLHGLLDYPMAILLIALPWLGGFATGGPEQWLPITAGITLLVIAPMTDYEVGLVRVVPMSGHLVLDVIMGGILAASPWLFGFAELVYVPHLAMGLLELGAAVTTQTSPGHRLARSAT